MPPCAAASKSIYFSPCCPAFSVDLQGSARLISHFPHCLHNCSTPPALRPSLLSGRSYSKHPHLLRPARCHGVAAAPPASDATSYTSMRSDPGAFWDAHQGLLLHQHLQLRPEQTFIVDDLNAEAELLLAAQLRLLATAASDRAEMHAILAKQRDNWNKLFQRMLSAACMTACILSALDGQTHALSLCLPALLLNAGSAAMMAIINQFQPSQLAEEQRTAARLFCKLSSDVHYALDVAPHLRQHTPSFFYDCQRRLEALDKAFPMPLTPGGLEKFPAKVVPPMLKEPLVHDGQTTSLTTPCNNVDANVTSPPCSCTNNGWDRHLTLELQKVANLLRRSDIPKYTNWAQNLVKVNKCFAVAAPLLAAAAATLNTLAIASLPVLPTTSTLGTGAAVCSVLAAFVGSLSHDMQLGMVFELYRNSAGYYADVEASIEEVLRTPAAQREHGILFRQRIAYQLGRSTLEYDPAEVSSYQIVPAGAQEAGTLF